MGKRRIKARALLILISITFFLFVSSSFSSDTELNGNRGYLSGKPPQQISPIEDQKETSALEREIPKKVEKKREVKKPRALLTDVFLVGMGEGVFGRYNVQSQGALPSTDYRLKEKIFSEGRFAFYFKGTLLEKFKITSSLDTKRDEDKLFRNLDDEKYYPTYGDDSTILEDTPTQGNFYFKAEWDKSNLLYGNYNTGITGTELSSYNRSLYGAKIDYESVEQTQFDTPKLKFIGYGAKAKQLAAHDEMESTGGSLYYLRHQHMIEGSEKIYVQVRDKETFFPKAQLELVPNTDYDIDYDDGRIILTNPLFMKLSTYDDQIIKNAILSGDPVYIIADYEYEPDGYMDNPSYGTRIVKEIGDNLRIGGTYVTEVQADKNYSLSGADVLLRLNDKNTSNLSLEYASSESNTITNSITYNGGISFSETTTPASNNIISSSAWKVKTNLDLKDFFEIQSLNSFDVAGYYQNIEPGFSSSSTISQEGAAKFGLEVVSKISDKTKVKISYDNQKINYYDNGYASGENINPLVQTSISATKSQIGTVAVDHQVSDKARITQEWRHQVLDNATVSKYEETQDIAATRLSYEFSDTFDGYLQQQYTISGKANNVSTVGISKSFKVKSNRAQVGSENAFIGAGGDNDSTVNLNAEYDVGTSGNAARFGISREEVDGSIFYMNYAVGNDIDGSPSTITTFGHRLKLSPTTEIYKEDLFSNNYSSWQRSNIMGIDYSPTELPNLTLGASYERSYLDDTSGESYKDAAAVKLTYFEEEKIKLSSKVELRNLRSDIDPTRQIATFNQLEYRLTPSLRFMGTANWSTTQELVSNSYDAHLEEYSLGFAYRPVKNDKLNIFGKYSYIVDDASEGQTDVQDIAESINHVYAIEGIYQLTPRIAFTGKYALKTRKEQTTSVSGHIKSTTDLWIGRISCKVFKDITLHVEDRLLNQWLSETKKNGLLIEITKPIGNLFTIGVGYSFTDFDDKDMSYLAGYTAEGPYFRFVTKFFESRK